MILNNNKGFTLVEIMVAAGLLGGLSLGVMSVMKNLNQGQVTSETKLEELELRRLISSVLTDKVACQKTFAGTSIGNELTQIKNSNNAVLYEKGHVYGNDALKINK